MKPTSQLVLGLPEHSLAPHAQPSPNSVQLEMTTTFPVTLVLPECALLADFNKQHGLPSPQPVQRLALPVCAIAATPQLSAYYSMKT